MKSYRRTSWIMLMIAITLTISSPVTAQSTSTTLLYESPGSEDATATAGVQPGSDIGTGDFVNEQAAVTLPPEEDFQNTVLSADDGSSIVGDVITTGSYADVTTLTAATAAEESSGEDDNTSASAATTTPVLLAVAAACVVAIGAIAIVKKRVDMRVPSPHTPVDKAIYYQVEVETTVKKPGYFHVSRQLTPPV